MTVDEIFDEVKKNGIPVGLDAWMPGKITTGNTTGDEEETTWRERSSDSFRKTIATSLYGSSLSKAEAEAFFQQAEKEQKEKEALELAKMYFG